MNRIPLYGLMICLTCNTFFLSACSKNKALEPTPLKQINSTVNVNKAWSINVDMNKKISGYLHLTPAFSDKVVFVAGNTGSVEAINDLNGDVIWQTKTDAPISSGIAVNNKYIFFGTNDAKVFALDKQNGKIKWQQDVIGEVLSCPTANAQIVIVKTSTGNLQALNAEDGKEIWSYKMQNPSLILRGSSSPQINKNSVISGFATGEIVSFDIKEGNSLWQQQVSEPEGSFMIERMVDIVADPVIMNNVVYVVAYQGDISAINASNGNVIWQKQLASTAGLTVDNNNVYVTTSDDKVLALNKNNGEKIWQQDTFGYRGLTAPAILHGLHNNMNVLVVADMEGYVHLLNMQNGSIVGRTKVSGKVYTNPISYGNAVYVYSVNGDLIKFS